MPGSNMLKEFKFKKSSLAKIGHDHKDGIPSLCYLKLVAKTYSAFSLSLPMAVRASSNLSCKMKLTTRHWKAFSSPGK